MVESVVTVQKVSDQVVLPQYFVPFPGDREVQTKYSVPLEQKRCNPGPSKCHLQYYEWPHHEYTSPRLHA